MVGLGLAAALSGCDGFEIEMMIVDSFIDDDEASKGMRPVDDVIDEFEDVEV